MFINSVLQKYPKLKRPEALFDITNIAIAATMENKDGFGSETKPEIFKMLCSIPVKSPFDYVWYEYRQEENSVVIQRGSYCKYNKRENVIHLLNFIFFNNRFLCYGETKVPLTKDFNYDNKKEAVYILTQDLKAVYDIACKIESISPEEFSRNEMDYFTDRVFFANALLNCKNVSTDSHEFQNRRSIQHYKRIGKPYFEKYYTLKLEVPGSKKLGETKDGVDSDGYTRAFHICRGHFKIYTEANPLFGKYTGTYWWNSQVRGDINVGVIDKDYKLSNKKEMVSV